MKKIILLLLILNLTSCVEENENSDPSDYATIEIITSSDILDLEHIQTDIFFHNTFDKRFVGVKNNEEIEIPISLDLEFNIPENTYGFNANIDRLIQINNRYDLVKGSVEKFLENQTITKNDTIYSIQGFSKKTEGDVLLFDKQEFKYIELEKGFWINSYVEDNTVQIIDNKLYYIKKDENLQTEIKYIDLNDLDALPELFYSSSERIIFFIINSQMDLHFRTSQSEINRYVSYETGLEFETANQGEPLMLHFVGMNGEFYAQHYWSSIGQPVRGFYTVDVQGNSVTASEVFSFNADNYDNMSHLGRANIVLPNYLGNNNLVISTGDGVTLVYEFFEELGTINPLNIESYRISFADFYEDDFFVLRDNYYRLRKYNLSNFNMDVEIDLGLSKNGIIINKNNGTIYALETHGSTKLIKIDIDNTITKTEFTKWRYGYFSVIN